MPRVDMAIHKDRVNMQKQLQLLERKMRNNPKLFESDLVDLNRIVENEQKEKMPDSIE